MNYKVPINKGNYDMSNTVIKYISRYLGRPVIALSRIDSYDGDNVTFHYYRHEDNAFVQKTIPVIDFIKLLIQHIPERNFKMTRYYGLYARHRVADPSPGCRAIQPTIIEHTLPVAARAPLHWQSRKGILTVSADLPVTPYIASLMQRYIPAILPPPAPFLFALPPEL